MSAPIRGVFSARSALACIALWDPLPQPASIVLVALIAVRIRRLSRCLAVACQDLPRISQDILHTPVDQLQFLGTPALCAQCRELL